MTTSGDGDERPTRLLLECLRNPDESRGRLPAVVGLLEHDGRRTRIAAAWTVCLLATSHSDAVPYVVRRLVDRLEDERSLELTHVLDYLADRYPEVVADVLEELAEEAEERADRRSLPLPETGAFTRNYYYDATPSRVGGGRIRLPGAAGEGDPRRAYTDDEPEPDRDESSVDADEDSPASAATEATDETGTEDASGTNPRAMLQGATDVTAIAARSRFDDLHVLAARRRSRYSADFDALVGSGPEEEAIALRLLQVPTDESAREDFGRRAGDRLEAWARVDDHEHVVSVLDWGRDPQPWLATSFTGDSLAELGSRSHEQAVEDAIALADAVASCHRSDVVHGGIDPQNVAYPGDVLESNDQTPPLLDNVGFVDLYRFGRNPADLLDPRYAAPEYYERRFGRVDAATDVYGLGAVLYRLLTDESPVQGSVTEVRSRITGTDTPVPTAVDGSIPRGLDDVVGKAMATQKLRRYDTVDHLRQDLEAIREDEFA